MQNPLSFEDAAIQLKNGPESKNGVILHKVENDRYIFTIEGTKIYSSIYSEFNRKNSEFFCCCCKLLCNYDLDDNPIFYKGVLVSVCNRCNIDYLCKLTPKNGTNFSKEDSKNAIDFEFKKIKLEAFLKSLELVEDWFLYFSGSHETGSADYGYDSKMRKTKLINEGQLIISKHKKCPYCDNLMYDIAHKEDSRGGHWHEANEDIYVCFNCKAEFCLWNARSIT